MKAKRYRAAGGVVLDSNGKVLLIERDVERDGKSIHEVRLPKGHIDDGETDEQAAIRETCEESGYCCLEIAADLGEHRVEYDFKGKHYVRAEHYFLMYLTSSEWRGPEVDPDSEEALFSVKWAKDLAHAERILTYDSERMFAARAAQYLASRA
ncbi:MAG: NUDIX domain-containing protein [Candidatus Hydrogenedentes bacterium]|nr:NUDIX domain-containing protein [Candidatus Hydrogenedentota bacterium]